MGIIKEAQAINDDLIKIRREFHKYPEVSGCEKETSKRVAEHLRKLGYEVTEGIGGYGVIATLKGNPEGRTVALRADMDALQIQELGETEYKSRYAGIMHACGHDNHMTILLGAARLLIQQKDNLLGTVRLIFQPSEELSPTGGSRKMIEEGALDGVDAVFGLHVWPELSHGTVGIKAGPLMAASDHFSVEIHGQSSHAAKPDCGIDAVVMGAQFVEAVQNIVSRETSPLKSAVVTIGTFHAGTRYNILAEECSLEGTCRTLDEEVREHAENSLRNILDGVCLMHGATGELNYERGYMAVVNDRDMVELVKGTASELFGADMVEDVQEPSMCAEDFAFYLKECPGAFVWLGTRTDQLNYPIHNSCFDVDEDILWRGAALLAETAINFLSR
ncbi:MAG: amidohydrolase [Clostridium sp.]